MHYRQNLTWPELDQNGIRFASLLLCQSFLPTCQTGLFMMVLIAIQVEPVHKNTSFATHLSNVAIGLSDNLATHSLGSLYSVTTFLAGRQLPQNGFSSLLMTFHRRHDQLRCLPLVEMCNCSGSGPWF